MFSDFFGSALNFLRDELKFKGDRQELRRVIRQRIIAPHILELYRPEMREKVANDIVAMALGQGGNSYLAAIAMYFMKETVIPMKVKLISDMLAEAYPSLRDVVVVTEDKENATFRVTQGMDAMQRLVRDILTVL